jgi:hypothetical protein
MAENFLDGTGDKPISWWMFEEAASPSLDGNTTNNNDLTWNQATQDTAAVRQGAASVRAITGGANAVESSLANLSANFPFKGATTAFSVGGWVYFPGYTEDAWPMRFIGTAGQGFWVYVSGSKPGFFLNNGTQIYTNANPSVGWHHVVARWNGENRSGAGADDEISLWLDGVKQTATTTVTSVGLVTSGFGLELRSFTGNLYNFDEWFIFDLALLDTQIADIYQFGLDGTSHTVPGTSRLAWMTA